MKKIYDLNSISFRIPILKQPGDDPFDLTNATIEAAARKAGGTDATRYAGTVSIVNALGGICQVSFPPATFEGETGAFLLHVRAQRDGEDQTVAETTFAVEKSVRLPE